MISVTYSTKLVVQLFFQNLGRLCVQNETQVLEIVGGKLVSYEI